MDNSQFTAAATQAMAGENETLWLAIHDRLRRAPTSVAECASEIAGMSHYERVLYGIQDWSDDSKRFCPQCRSDYRGTSCPSCAALARDASEAAA